MARCNYQSKAHGLLLPVFQEISGISIPNVEPQNTEIINYFIMNKVTVDKKAKKSNEDGV